MSQWAYKFVLIVVSTSVWFGDLDAELGDQNHVASELCSTTAWNKNLARQSTKTDGTKTKQACSRDIYYLSSFFYKIYAGQSLDKSIVRQNKKTCPKPHISIGTLSIFVQSDRQNCNPF